ncbi:MAG: hypothetical protein IKH86_05225 [Prevotella sp.]|nr:hypothetical protein [Prevotella sp.]
MAKSKEETVIPVEWLLAYCDKWIDNAHVVETISHMLTQFFIETGAPLYASQVNDELHKKYLNCFSGKKKNTKPPKNEKDISLALIDAKKYVEKLKDQVWQASRDNYLKMWDEIFQLEELQSLIAEYGNQRHTTFNRYIVCNIIYMLNLNRIFKKQIPAAHLALLLENSKDCSQSKQLGRTVEDMDLKNAVMNIINKYKELKKR